VKEIVLMLLLGLSTWNRFGQRPVADPSEASSQQEQFGMAGTSKWLAL
jgi:hypothetical protein